MSAGSSASNLGYGESALNSNINSVYANPTNSHNPAIFTNSVISGGLPEAKWNVDAANSCVPGACYTGGSKRKQSKRKQSKRKQYNKRRSHLMKDSAKVIKDIANDGSKTYESINRC